MLTPKLTERKKEIKIRSEIENRKTVEKINQFKFWFVGKINKSKKTHITNMRYERRDNTAVSMDTKS